MGENDRLVRRGAAHGQFSVSYRDRLAKEFKQKAGGDEGSNTTGAKDEVKLWSKVW